MSDEKKTITITEEDFANANAKVIKRIIDTYGLTGNRKKEFIAICGTLGFHIKHELFKEKTE